MNEISVVVNQEPGKISWNFAEIKKRLEEELAVYQNTAYTDDTIKTAKGDVADLRKLAKAIEDRRKEVKGKVPGALRRYRDTGKRACRSDRKTDTGNQ